MINILFLIDYISNINGGTEGQLKMLISNLDRSKYNIHLACLRGSGMPCRDKMDIPVKTFHVNKLVGPSVIPEFFKFRRYCKVNKIDILQTFFNDSLIFGAWAGRFSGVPHIIASRRNLGPGFWNQKRVLLAFRILKRLVSRYMTNSQATKDSIVMHEGIDPDRVDVIYNGLDIERFCSIDSDRRNNFRKEMGIDKSDTVIGMISHLRKEKNIPLLIEAAKILTQKYPRIRFWLIGDGYLHNAIKDQIRDLHLEDKFMMMGGVMDVVPYLAAMDIGCLTSDGESFSNSIIEYMIAGLPVVATSVGGNVEALKSCGHLFPPGDLNKFVEILSMLIENKELARQSGLKARNFAQANYSIDRMISGHEEMYNKCMENGKNR